MLAKQWVAIGKKACIEYVEMYQNNCFCERKNRALKDLTRPCDRQDTLLSNFEKLDAIENEQIMIYSLL